MKTQTLLLALAATLNLAVADVANVANVAEVANVADIANVANVAAADAVATAAVTADKADEVPEFWDWNSDEEGEEFGRGKGKKGNNRKGPPRPVRRECKPGTYACDWNPKKGAGIRVCTNFGFWIRQNDCGRNQKCYFNVKNKTPYCLPDY
ncbi:hypothetical protein QBC42DRAFT_255500 [Cladorrhinum samala]|uniref:Uncharacterized protein n=1 Tax=Cladorrhinum samala TaxID=585594 RepID=A0AAV9HGU8_9PEZI|nr:hypothetical protein QBC42DRAFT_255500 [Cladorrhinum samala]